MKLHDTEIWPIVREAAATNGWHEREASIEAAHREICGRFGIEDDAERAAMRRRLERLWDETLAVMGAG